MTFPRPHREASSFHECSVEDSGLAQACTSLSVNGESFPMTHLRDRNRVVLQGLGVLDISRSSQRPKHGESCSLTRNSVSSVHSKRHGVLDCPFHLHGVQGTALCLERKTPWRDQFWGSQLLEVVMAMTLTICFQSSLWDRVRGSLRTLLTELSNAKILDPKPLSPKKAKPETGQMWLTGPEHWIRVINKNF